MIDEQTIRTFMSNQHLHGTTVRIDDQFIEHLTSYINVVLSTAKQVGFVKEELEGLKEMYEENCAVLDMEMARLVNQCTHPSHDEHIVEGMSLVICNICGGIVEENL